MSFAALPTTTGVLGAGNYNNPPKRRRERRYLPPSEIPSSKNIYNSDRYREVENKVLNRSEQSYKKAYDPWNKNVIGPQYNYIGNFKPHKTRMKEQQTKRQQIKRQQTKRQSFINDGTMTPEQELQQLNQSPMFSNMQLDPRELKTEHNNIYSGGWSSISDPKDNRKDKQYNVDNRRGPVSGNLTKQEHFQSYTIHGPQNSNDPRFHNNMVPFFGSKGTQNMNPDMQNHRLEVFTGQTNNDTEFRSLPKREMLSLFDQTAGDSYVYGTPADNVTRDLDRYVTSTLKTDTLPTEQERVGPGINYGYLDKPHDGYQTWYRPTFKNVDELRVNPKNTYEGRVVAGSENVKNRGVIGDVYKRRADRFYVNSKDRWFKTTGSYTEPAVRENFHMYKTNRESSRTEDYKGIAGARDNLGSYIGTHLQGEN